MQVGLLQGGLLLYFLGPGLDEKGQYDLVPALWRGRNGREEDIGFFKEALNKGLMV